MLDNETCKLIWRNISGPKPLKRFTPPPEPARPESRSEEEESSEYEEEEEEEDVDQSGKLPEDIIEVSVSYNDITSVSFLRLRQKVKC